MRSRRQIAPIVTPARGGAVVDKPEQHEQHHDGANHGQENLTPVTGNRASTQYGQADGRNQPPRKTAPRRLGDHPV